VEEFYFQGCNAVYSIIFLDLGVFVTSLWEPQILHRNLQNFLMHSDWTGPEANLNSISGRTTFFSSLSGLDQLWNPTRHIFHSYWRQLSKEESETFTYIWCRGLRKRVCVPPQESQGSQCAVFCIKTCPINALT
jgi:hypothetical protein